MEFTNKKSYIIVPNVAFGFNTKYHLTTDELMVFAHLQMIKAVGLDNQLMTMVDVIVAGLEWDKSNITRDRKRVEKALTGLHDKGYITIEFNGAKIVKSVLTITINKELEKAETESTVEWKEAPFVWKGFTRIENNEYNQANNDGQYLMVIAYTKWRENAKFTYRISYQEWQEVLDVSDNTARTVITECEPFINKISGSFYKDENGQMKQKPNEYSVKPKTDVKESEKKAKAMTALEKFANKVTDARYKYDDDILKQINDYGTKWRLDGYTAWVESDCPVLKEAGKKKFEMLEKAGQGWIQEKLEEEYEGAKTKSQKVETLADNHLAYLNGDINYDYGSNDNNWIKEWSEDEAI